MRGYWVFYKQCLQLLGIFAIPLVISNFCIKPFLHKAQNYQWLRNSFKVWQMLQNAYHVKGNKCLRVTHIPSEFVSNIERFRWRSRPMIKSSLGSFSHGMYQTEPYWEDFYHVTPNFHLVWALFFTSSFLFMFDRVHWQRTKCIGYVCLQECR